MVGWITFSIVVSLIALAWRDYKRWEYRDKVRLRLQSIRTEYRNRHPWPPRGMDRLLTDMKTEPCPICSRSDCPYTENQEV